MIAKRGSRSLVVHHDQLKPCYFWPPVCDVQDAEDEEESQQSGDEQCRMAGDNRNNQLEATTSSYSGPRFDITEQGFPQQDPETVSVGHLASLRRSTQLRTASKHLLPRPDRH